MTIVRALVIACVCLLPLGCGGSEKKDDKPADGAAAPAASTEAGKPAKPADCKCPGETCACDACKTGGACTCKP